MWVWDKSETELFIMPSLFLCLYLSTGIANPIVVSPADPLSFNLSFNLSLYNYCFCMLGVCVCSSSHSFFTYLSISRIVDSHINPVLLKVFSCWKEVLSVIVTCYMWGVKPWVYVEHRETIFYCNRCCKIRLHWKWSSVASQIKFSHPCIELPVGIFSWHVSKPYISDLKHFWLIVYQNAAERGRRALFTHPYVYVVFYNLLSTTVKTAVNGNFTPYLYVHIIKFIRHECQMKPRKLKDRLRDVGVVFCDAGLFVSLFVHACMREIASSEKKIEM